ncbi:MAG: DUF3899 domain-containing protein [Bacteroidaceae bacterium]|nr:DUF3899 domain-containing protein [Bacteroidaceae bacterium]
MNKDTRITIIKYAVCFVIELLIGFLVVWSKGFFTDRVSVNLQILADAFVVPGLLMTLLAGLLLVSNEGGFLGIGFILRNVVLAFVPMGRAKHEVYRDYRERKLNKPKSGAGKSIFVSGLLFLLIGIVLTLIWYVKFYD